MGHLNSWVISVKQLRVRSLFICVKPEPQPALQGDKWPACYNIKHETAQSGGITAAMWMLVVWFRSPPWCSDGRLSKHRSQDPSQTSNCTALLALWAIVVDVLKMYWPPWLWPLHQERKDTWYLKKLTSEGTIKLEGKKAVLLTSLCLSQ